MPIEFAIRVMVSTLSIATVLSLVAASLSLVTRRRSPALEHLCWVLVLVRLVVPPMFEVPIPGYPQLRLSSENEPLVETASSRNEGTGPENNSMLIVTDQHDMSDNRMRTRVDAAIEQVDVKSGAPVNQIAPVSMLPNTTDTSGHKGSRSQDTNRSLDVTSDPAGRMENINAAAIKAALPNHQVAMNLSLGEWLIAVCFGGWLIGSIYVALRALRAIVSFRRILRLAATPPSNIISLAERIANQIGLRRAPMVRILEAHMPPMVWSRMGTPLIVLPRYLTTEERQGQLELMLIHELSHIRRGDHWVRWLELLAGAVWWWCPLYRWARIRLRRAEEVACDALVLELRAGCVAEYSRAIVDMVCYVGDQSLTAGLATGGLGSVREVEARLRSMYRGGVSARTQRGVAFGVLVLGCIASSLMLAEADTVRNGTEDQPEPELQTVVLQPKDFDPAVVLAANRLWQNPPLREINSIEFVHRMAPQRLDERFVWRKDGPIWVEVVHREDRADQYPQGWSRLSMLDGSNLTTSSRSAYPRLRTSSDVEAAFAHSTKRKLAAKEILRRELLTHLSGTRVNFGAIEWGRRPLDFVVADHTIEDGIRVVDLRPTSEATRDFRLNTGAMFATTSWAYVHDVNISRSLLSINDRHQIIRERAYSADKLIADIELLDWVVRTDGQQAPLRIVMSLPANDFRVEQRFRVTDEGLWILESGTAQFSDHDAQTEEIVDLKVNGPTESLDQQVKLTTSKWTELTHLEEPRSTVDLQGLTAMEIGATHHFPRPTDEDWRPESICFQPFDRRERFREMGSRPELIAQLRYPPVRPSERGSGSLMLALYDESRRPLFALSIPDAVSATGSPTADSIFNASFAKQRLWLRNTDEPLPNATYTFRVGDKKVDASVPENQDGFNRGITLRFALDSILAHPEQWRVPVAFQGEWLGRRVTVIGVTGPPMGQVFGSGLKGNYVGGYSASNPTHVWLVLDAVTGFPLLERSDGIQFEFLEYVELNSKLVAPRRIVCRSHSIALDLRFQVADDRLWLFDHVAGPDVKSRAFVDDIKIDGQLATSLRRSEIPDAADTPPELQWRDIKERTVFRADDRFSETVARSLDPSTQPWWQASTRVSHESSSTQHNVRVSLHTWPTLGDVRYWSLTRIQGDSAKALTCPESIPPSDASRVVSNPFELTDSRRVAEQSREEEMRIHKATVARTGSHDFVKLDLLSTKWYSEQWARVTALRVTPEGVVVDGGVSETTFRTWGEPTAMDDLIVRLASPLEVTDSRLVLGCQAKVVGQPMGSMWGRLAIDDPIIPIDRLLKSRFANVREFGLQQLYRHDYRDLTRQYARRDRDDRAAKVLSSYTADLGSILSNENGDSAESLGVACRLAGFSGNRSQVPLMIPLLRHASDQVADSAAIGLGLLGQRDGIDRLRKLVDAREQPPSGSDQTTTDEMVREATWALERLNVGTTR